MLCDIEASGFFFLAHAQASPEQRLDDEPENEIGNPHERDGYKDAEHLRAEQGSPV